HRNRRSPEGASRDGEELDSKRLASVERRITGRNVKNCDQLREMFEAYALGALDPAERSSLEAHLGTGCKDCAKAVADARSIVSQLGYLAPEAAPSDMLKGRLMEIVRAEARGEKTSTMPKSVIPLWMWAGVAALLLFTAYSAWNTRTLQQQIQAANRRA